MDSLFPLFDSCLSGLPPLQFKGSASFSDSCRDELRGFDILIQEKGQSLVHNGFIVFRQCLSENGKIRFAGLGVDRGLVN